MQISIGSDYLDCLYSVGADLVKMGARNPERELMKQKVAFENHVKLAESALKSVKTTAKKLLNMVTDLKGAYFQLVEGFYFYKADVIDRECKTEDAFNRKDEHGADNYTYNDTWSDEHKYGQVY